MSPAKPVAARFPGPVLAGIVLAAGLLLHGVAAAPAGGLDQARAGLAALAGQDWRMAVTLLSEAIDSNELPEEQHHLFLAARGYAKAALGNYQAAIVDYSKVLEKDAGFQAAMFNRGNAHFALHHYDLAISDYSKALEADVADARALNNRGAAWFKKGNLQSAMANYTMAMAVAPDDPDLYLNRGKVYEALGDADKAREDFLQVKKLDPSAKTPLD
ncbi:tetratricopeptide repeat protein [Solidesulfovibrio sp.]